MKSVNNFKGFLQDRSGAIAMIFGLSLLPVAAGAGAAVDYARAATARTEIQAAVDATALALARDALGMNDAQMKARGQQFFNGYVRDHFNVALQPLTVTRDAKTIRVAANGTVPMVIMGVVNRSTTDIAVQSEVAWGQRKIELALVLDNTGSMGTLGKMDALKDAATDLLNTLQKVAYNPDIVKVSIVPFDTQVRLDKGLKDADWLDFSLSDKSKWDGYVIDRAQMNGYDAKDTPPNISNALSLYPAVENNSGAALTAIRPLTNDFDALRATVASMKPRGCTNITLGAAWGMATLSSGVPFTEASAPGTKDVDKIMILLTDGQNTLNRFVSNPGCPEGTSVTAQIDSRTQMACDGIKTAGVRVYSVRVIEGNAGLLQNCASTPAMYYDVKNASDLKPVFQKIASEIAAVRITQ